LAHFCLLQAVQEVLEYPNQHQLSFGETEERVPVEI
jgi:hypothetical protein